MESFVTTGSYRSKEITYSESVTNDLDWFIKDFKPHFRKSIYQAIDRLVANEPLIGFIFMSCVIDYLTGFMEGADPSGKTYKLFIREHFPPRKYNSRALYQCLRCGLVHSFTINNNRYVLNSGHPEQHLKKTKNGLTILNASDFRDDLIKAANKYFDYVESDPPSLLKLVQRYKEVGFMDFGPITIRV
jgi:hypothetical protein